MTLWISDSGKKHLKSAVYALGKLCPVSPKNLSEGMLVCLSLHTHGILSTLGKFSKAGDDPALIVEEYQTASNSMEDPFGNDFFYLSLKPPALEFDAALGAAIASAALQNGQGVHFDSHKYSQADPTMKMIEQVMAQGIRSGDAGGRWKYSVTLPSRWKRSIEDARWAAGKGVRVRIVKGEFRADDESEEMDPAAGFLELVDYLAGRVPEIAVATHDYQLAEQALARCVKANCPVQLELLFGMPVEKMIALSRKLGIPVRFYIPYGDTLFIYGCKFFLKNPFKLLRADFSEILATYGSKLERIIRELQFVV